MLFNLIKEIYRLLSNVLNSVKEINRLSKGMSNIYLKVTVETFSKLRFSGLKNLSPGQFWGAPTDADIIEF